MYLDASNCDYIRYRNLQGVLGATSRIDSVEERCGPSAFMRVVGSFEALLGLVQYVSLQNCSLSVAD